MIRAIVVDDEVPSLDKLVKLLENHGNVQVDGRFTKPLEALAFLKENKVDVVFLDIEMPDINGIELSSRIIDLQEGIAIVFVTAYSQYAVEAFQLNALDYLMKPVSAKRLLEAVGKLIERKGISVVSKGVNIRCFDRFGVSNGIEEVKFRTVKAEELLAFMIDKRGSFISRSEIIDSLWADFDGERALIHFNTTLHYVKKALQLYGVQIHFTYDRGCYKFEVAGLDCDYLKFCRFVDKGKVPGPENIVEFEEMAGLFKGKYLSGWDNDWAAIKRLLLEEQYFNLILQISEYYKGTAAFKEAAKWIKEALQREPLHRELNYSLIEVLLLDNDCVLASKYYNQYQKSLMKNHGQKPDEAFARLFG